MSNHPFLTVPAVPMISIIATNYTQRWQQEIGDDQWWVTVSQFVMATFVKKKSFKKTRMDLGFANGSLLGFVLFIGKFQVPSKTRRWAKHLTRAKDSSPDTNFCQLHKRMRYSIKRWDEFNIKMLGSFWLACFRVTCVIRKDTNLHWNEFVFLLLSSDYLTVLLSYQSLWFVSRQSERHWVFASFHVLYSCIFGVTTNYFPLNAFHLNIYILR